MSFQRPLLSGGGMFCVFLMVVAVFGSVVLVKVSTAPKDPQQRLAEVLAVSREERMLRNLQDPLALRLYALKHARPYFSESESPAIFSGWVRTSMLRVYLN
jgi:uncharacterized membrane protein